MQTQSLISWMKKDSFLSMKRELDGYIMYRALGENVLVRQVCPSKKVRKLLQNEVEKLKLNDVTKNSHI